MDFTRNNALVSAQDTLTVAGELRRLMRERGLSRSDLANIMRTAPRTLDNWLDGKAEPPGVVSVVLDLLKECSCSRRALGINTRHTAAPRGQVFKRGTPRTCGPCRDEMLRLVQAI